MDPKTKTSAVQPAPADRRPSPVRVKTHVRAGGGEPVPFDSQNSDVRLKTEIKPVASVLERLARLDLVIE